ncbi:glycoside hydrolase superfamily [Naematelia encephala]|uniref:beta-glucosidase n=1 Tax=Naematelia encephala TaxID=71784 RepID=A0A1Y2AKX1_9TREE|nr:glycoside hydrolase superfamily [Naematelia encephala]
MMLLLFTIISLLSVAILQLPFVQGWFPGGSIFYFKNAFLVNSTDSPFSPYTSANQSSPLYGAVSPPFHYPLDSSYRHNNEHLSPRWEKAHARARSRLENWTAQEKVNLTTGAGWEIGRCVGNIPPIPSQNFPGLCLEDSPTGVRFADYVSAFPAGHNVASTFDKNLMYAHAYAMGEEFRGKGVHVALAPMTNMGRVAAGGRNWEGFGGDPYLSGWATEMSTKGLQDAGVQACAKHFVGNEQERNRTTSSSNIGDRTMREIYSHPFLRAVAADVASIMCSYNLVNNSWACQNSEILNGILKTDFGFQGYIMSDWQATESGVSAVNSGLDMTMPGDILFYSLTSYFGTNLTTAVNNGSVALDRLDDMAQRIMAGYYLLDQEEGFPDVNFDAFRRRDPVNNTHVDVRGDHHKLIRHIGAASTVLLKNVNGALPLKAPRSIALVGEDLGPSAVGPNGCADRGCDRGTLAMAWGSGTADFPYLVDPLSAISHRAIQDRSLVSYHLDNYDLAGVNATAVGPDVVIVGINSDSGEQYITYEGNEGDRNNLTAWLQGDDVVLAVAANNNNTIVVVHSVGPIIMEEWIDHPNVTAVLWAGLPGQESGNALVDILYGAYNPSGRLPYTIAKRRSDYSADIIYVETSVPVHPQVNYDEGLEIDYRHFLAHNITPRYEFGYGLSYTEFNFTNPQVWELEADSKRWNDAGDDGKESNGKRAVGAFLRESLQRPRWTASADIQNVGSVDGCEVPQLYLEFPAGAGEPPRVLRDFARINLEPFAAQKVEFNLSRYDVSIWDVVSQDWVIPQGEFGVVVAKSSLDGGVRVPYCFSGSC